MSEKISIVVRVSSKVLTEVLGTAFKVCLFCFVKSYAVYSKKRVSYQTFSDLKIFGVNVFMNINWFNILIGKCNLILNCVHVVF